MRALSLGDKVTGAFLGWRLKNAVRRENVNTVQRLATPQLFETLSEAAVAKIMTVACKNASQMKPSRNSEIILDHLFHNGGVLSIQCIHTSFKDNKPSLGILGYKWMQMAVDCNAVHDNLKYAMLRQGIHNHDLNANRYGHELSESVLAKWPNYFLTLDPNMRERLWKQIAEKGSDRLLRLFIEITPKDYIKIDYLRYLHERNYYPKPLSVETLEALHHKGFSIYSLMCLWITGKETSNRTSQDFKAHLDRNPTLVKNITQLEDNLAVAEQRQRLLDETEQVYNADTPKVKARKM